MSKFLSTLLLTVCCVSSAFGYSEDVLRNKLSELLNRTGTKSNVIVIDLLKSKVIFQRDATKSVKPASVLKTLTSSVALSVLGPDYRFKTELWVDGNVASGVISTLYVKGSGDPSFTIEDLLMVTRKLSRYGIKKIDKIVLDDTLFDSSYDRVGQRAYEAGASALPLNFNTLSFDVCPTEIGRPARVLPDPMEVGVDFTGQIITSGKRRDFYSIDDAMQGGSISFRLSGKIGKGASCETVYRSIAKPTVYFGQTLLGLLQSKNIKVGHAPVAGKVPKGARFLFRHDSKPLSQIVWDLNHYSTNFIAEQLLYHIGFSRQPQLSRDTGLARMGMYLQKLGFSDGEFHLSDGSGLSHNNRISALILGRVLVDVYKNQRIWPEFEASLAIAGQSGTLKKRMRGLKGAVVRAKTGSLRGVTSLAGYIVSDKGNRFVFVSITNGGPGFGKAKRLEEDLVKTVIYNQ